MRQDTQLSVLYIIKGLRFGMIVGALSFATILFVNRYNQAVIFDKKPAPSFTELLIWFLCIDLAFNAVLWLILMLLKHQIDATTDSFILFDETFRSRFVIDYALTTSLILAIGYIIALVLRKKITFNTLGSQGDDEIYSFKKMMLAVSGVVLLIPFLL